MEFLFTARFSYGVIIKKESDTVYFMDVGDDSVDE
jgi:hypothetical protein